MARCFPHQMSKNFTFPNGYLFLFWLFCHCWRNTFLSDRNQSIFDLPKWLCWAVSFKYLYYLVCITCFPWELRQPVAAAMRSVVSISRNTSINMRKTFSNSWCWNNSTRLSSGWWGWLEFPVFVFKAQIVYCYSFFCLF